MTSFRGRWWLPGVLSLALLLVACEPATRAAADPPATAPAAQAVKAVASPATTLPGIEQTLSDIYERLSSSVVNVQMLKQVRAEPGADMFPQIPGFPRLGPDDRGQRRRGPTYQGGSGSGFVWDDQGHIVTNNHVAGGADKVTVTFHDGSQVQAKLVGTDPDSDLAVLKVDLPEGSFPPVRLADSTRVKVGQLAVAIGNPFGLEGSMTVGFVSALGRLLPVDPTATEAGYSIPDMIQTDAPINPGNSGGVLVDSAGQVIGVPSIIISPAGVSAGIGFAIPSAVVAQVVPVLIEKGRYEHPWLGISGLSLTPDMAKAMQLPATQRGALVVDVLAGSPADKAGLRGSDRQILVDGQEFSVGGDVITRINEASVKRFDDIVTYLARSTKVGDTLKLSLLRGGKETTVSVLLAARPGADQDKLAKAQGEPAAEGGWLGIAGATLEAPVAAAMGLKRTQRGVLVDNVAKDSPADLAGLRGSTRLARIQGQTVAVGGDVIIAIGAAPLSSIEELQAKLAQFKPGAQIDLAILRDGQRQTVKVTLGKMPE